MSYCTSRFHTIRRATHEVMIGGVGVGGTHPVRVQSMTTSDTQDIAATVKQSIALAEVGCEIIRITAPNVPAAQCLKPIREQFTAAGFGHIPLVADIHFLPAAAMEAVEHVEKVRVNPGNYADKKKFAVREYSDSDYDIELQRLHDSFTPLVLRAKTLGRALRIGTNHGSLSDRIMNRYGDTPLGMVESALEFLRIAESHAYKQIVLSMKSSNPKVMIEAYRLLVQRMAQENMHYPLHLGVTEAGDGEDGRIKSAIGIGSLLLDGLGDTIRVSLTEDSVYEIPVAQALANKAMSLWPTEQPGHPTPASTTGHRSLVTGHSMESLRDSIDPFHFLRRSTASLAFSPNCLVGPEQPPRVIVRAPSISALAETLTQLASPRLVDTPAEGILVEIDTVADILAAAPILQTKTGAPAFFVLELSRHITTADIEKTYPDRARLLFSSVNSQRKKAPN
ncbi:MAG: (E)-4-hydroxy-3-methylbut-2-enyl-diphosphate synthase [Nibricoccus sp.]